MKKLLVLLALCMVLSVVLVACDKPEGPTDETTVGTTEAPTTDAPTTEDPTTDVPTTQEPTTEPPTTQPPTTESTTEPEPDPDPVTTHISFDECDPWIGDTQGTAFFTPGASNSWDKIALVEDYNVTAIRVWGWAGFFAETIGEFGYQIGDAEPVYSADFAYETGDDVKNAAAAGGAKSASRFLIMIPVEYVGGEVTIKALVKDAVGTVEVITEFTLNKTPNPNAPVVFVPAADMASSIPGSPGVNSAELSADGYYVTIDTVNQGDPYYQLPMINGKGYVAQFVAIKYRTESTYTASEMFVGSGAGPNGQGDNIRFELTCDGNWNLAIIDLAQATAVVDGVVNYLRWDPFAGGGTTPIDLGYIGLFTTTEAALAYDAQFAGVYRDVPLHEDLAVDLGVRDGDTPFSPAADKKVGQKLPLGETFLKQITIKNLACYSDGNTNTWSFKIWQWAGDYESTVAGTPLYVITGENHMDCGDFVANIPAKLLISGDVYYEAEYLTGTGGFTGWTAKDIFEGVETYSGGVKKDGGFAASVVVGVELVKEPNGSEKLPLTVGETLAATSGLEDGQATDVKYYTKGVVTEIGQGGSFYKNVYFTDGENTMLIYTLNPMEGMPELQVGDTITVCGYVKNYKGTIEFASKKMEDESQVYVYVIAYEAAPAEKVVVDPRDLAEGAITGHQPKIVTSAEEFANHFPMINAAGLTSGAMIHQGSINLGTFTLQDFSKVVIYYATDWGEGTQAGLAAAKEQGFGRLGISAVDCNGVVNPTADHVFVGTPYTPDGGWQITAHEIDLTGIEYTGDIYVSADFLGGQFIIIDRVEFIY